MYFLKESKISGGSYYDIKISENLSELMLDAEKRHRESSRRFVIVDEQGNIMAYSEDIRNIINHHELLARTNQKIPRYVVEDEYLIRLFRKNKIPFYTSMEFLERFKPTTKRTKHNFVFGKNTKE